MDDTRRVSFFERTRYLNCDVEDLGSFKVRGSHLAAQRDAVDEFGGDVVSAFVDADFVNRENVWMIKVRCR